MRRDTRSGGSLGLDLDASLQRHPDLVRSIACPDTVFPAHRPSDAVRLSDEALEILDGFARPRRIRDAVPDADDQVMDALADWTRRGLLVRTSRPVHPSRSMPKEALLWAGVVPKMRRRIARLVPSRREKIQGRDLAVIDGLFTEAEVQEASTCFHECAFAKTVTKGHARDVYELPARVPFVDCVTAVAERALPALRLELYWAYGSRTRYGDVAFAHADSREPSVTALYYANARWDDDWGGETLFHGEENEATVVVAPRPGRLVIFDGQMGHRGGVPSRMCHEARVSVVVKYWVRGPSR